MLPACGCCHAADLRANWNRTHLAGLQLAERLRVPGVGRYIHYIYIYACYKIISRTTLFFDHLV